MKLINKLLSSEGFYLLSWDDRYSKGIWVCLALTPYDLEEVESATDAGDLDMIPATDYLTSVDWLPFVTASSFTDALDNLEDRLSKIPAEHLGRSTIWSNAVGSAIEHLREVSKSSTDYGDMEGKFYQLSNDYEKVWEQAGK